jgi:2-iminobutanoate/2-iminopropanoate deaminase
MRFHSVTSDALPTPAGAYSHVIEANGVVWTAGFGPQDPRSGVVPEGIAAQTAQVLDNVEQALREVGLDLTHVVKATVHLQNPDEDFTAFDEVYGARLKPPYPVRTTVGSRLAGILVEVDVVAVRPTDETGRD